MLTQIEEEENLIQELKKIEQRKKERDKKTQDLQKLITAADTSTDPRRNERKQNKKKVPLLTKKDVIKVKLVSEYNNKGTFKHITVNEVIAYMYMLHVFNSIKYREGEYNIGEFDVILIYNFRPLQIQLE